MSIVTDTPNRFALIADTHTPDVFPFQHELLSENSLLRTPSYNTIQAVYLFLRDRQDPSSVMNELLQAMATSLTGITSPLSEAVCLDIMGIFYLYCQEEFVDLDVRSLKRIYATTFLNKDLNRWVQKFFLNNEKVKAAIHSRLEA